MANRGKFSWNQPTANSFSASCFDFHWRTAGKLGNHQMNGNVRRLGRPVQHLKGKVYLTHVRVLRKSFPWRPLILSVISENLAG